MRLPKWLLACLAGAVVVATVVGCPPLLDFLRTARDSLGPRGSVVHLQSEIERSGSKKIAWVRLAGFTSGSGEDIKAAVEKELKAGAKGVVLDLRHNGGGLLNEAVTVSSVFLEDGRVVSILDTKRLLERAATSIARRGERDAQTGGES